MSWTIIAVVAGWAGCTEAGKAPTESAGQAARVALDRDAERLRAHRERRAEAVEFGHEFPHGTCVAVQAPPPAWAYRADGTLKDPSEIHRPKDGNEQILYLNVDGAHITPGNDNPQDNQSFIPYSAIDVPPFDDEPFQRDSLDSRAKVIDAIRRWVQYYYAPVGVRVVTERPDSGDYTMMMIGGGPELVGQGSGVLGVATFDCYQDPNNVGFVFSEDHSNRLEMLVLTIVHEAGHTFGLAHIYDDTSIMYPANVGGDAYWGSGQAEGQACDGSSTQDSLEMLKDMLGERLDSIPPWVEIVDPGPGSTMPATFDALVHGTDNVVLYQVELYVDGASVGRETLPAFEFRVNTLADGPHALYAVGEDAHGNTFQSATVDITVADGCEALGQCEEGQRAVGELCAVGDDCQTGLCARSSEGVSVCARECSEDNPCPFGTECLGEGGTPDNPETYCAQGTAPLTLLEGAALGPYKLSGCQTSGPGGALPVLGVMLILGLARRRRR